MPRSSAPACGRFPSGAVSVKAAIAFMVAQLALGAAILFSLNRLSILLGFLVIVLIATYPFMKRITYWPQFFLGLNFNWGALMGWAAVRGDLGASALALCRRHRLDLGLRHDLCASGQGRRPADRRQILGTGIGPTHAAVPLHLLRRRHHAVGDRRRERRLRLALSHRADLRVLPALLASKQVDISSQPDCSRKFRSNRWTGWILLVGIIAAHVL